MGIGSMVMCGLGDSARSIAPSQELFKSSENCLAEQDITKAVLSLSATFGDAQDAGKLLLTSSRLSSICRQQIIAAIMKAMDKPDLDIRRDQASDDLWREGAALLGDLKATQALDLLLSHIEMNDGEWSITMIHQPAIEGIIRMGPIAIPKLSVMLLNSPDRELRRDFVYCIAWIGGASARRALQQALPAESDPCIRRFIRVSINTVDIKSGGLKSDSGQWLAAFLCHEQDKQQTAKKSGPSTKMPAFPRELDEIYDH